MIESSTLTHPLGAALFKLKQDADPKSIQKWARLAHAMVGKVPGKRFPVNSRHADPRSESGPPTPGLIDLQAGPPIAFTAPLAKGFDMGVVVLLDYVESLATFFTHPSHDEYVPYFPLGYQEFRGYLSTDVYV